MSTITATTAVPAHSLRRSHRLLIGLGLFSIAGAGVVTLAPPIAVALGNSGQPSFPVIAATGAALILLAGAFLAYVGRVLGFGRAWLMLAVLSDAALLVYKFVVVPVSFYSTTFTLGPYFSIDPNQPGVLGWVGLGSFISLAVVVVLARGIFGRSSAAAKAGPDGSHPRRRVQPGVLIALVAIVGVAALCLLPALAFTVEIGGSFEVGAVIGVVGGLVPLLGVVWLVSTSGAFMTASWRAEDVRDVTVISAFLWVALALLLIVHILWVVYMGVLAHLLPFKTVTQGK
jgi:hypothetical protein